MSPDAVGICKVMRLAVALLEFVMPIVSETFHPAGVVGPEQDRLLMIRIAPGCIREADAPTKPVSQRLGPDSASIVLATQNGNALAVSWG